jgi:hypothetical protein
MDGPIAGKLPWWRLESEATNMHRKGAGPEDFADAAHWAYYPAYRWDHDDPEARALKALATVMLVDRPGSLCAVDTATGRVAFVAVPPGEYRLLEDEWHRARDRCRDLERQVEAATKRAEEVIEAARKRVETAISATRAILAHWPGDSPPPPESLLREMMRIEGHLE